MLDTNMIAIEALHLAAQGRGDQQALVWGDVRVTHGQLLNRVEGLVTRLCELGLGRGDKVVALLAPAPELAYLCFAVAQLGAVIVPLDPRVRRRRLSAVFSDADPKVVVTERSINDAVRREAPGLRHVIGVGEGTDQDEGPSLPDLKIVREGEDNPPKATVLELSPDDLVALLSTSGTRGEPKAAMHGHRSLIAPVAATQKLREMWKRPSLKMLGRQITALARYRERLLRVAGGPQTLLSTTGWHTVTGLEVMLQGLITDDRLVVMSWFHPRHLLELVEREASLS